MPVRTPATAFVIGLALAAAPAAARQYETCEYVDATGVDIQDGHAKPCGAGYARPFHAWGSIQCKTVSIVVPGNEHILQIDRAKGANDWSAFDDNINVVNRGSDQLVSTTLRNWSENLRTQVCLRVQTDG